MIASEAPIQRLRLGSYDLIKIGHVEYRWDSTSDRGHVLWRTDGTGLHEDFSHVEIYELLQKGKLTVQHGHFSPTRAKTRALTHGVGWEHLTDEQRQKILWRLAYCDRFIQMEIANPRARLRSEKSMPEAVRTICREVADQQVSDSEAKNCGTTIALRLPPSWCTLLKWVNKYERSGYDKMALMEGRRRSGNRTPRLAPEISELIITHAKLYCRDNRKPTAAGVWKLLRGAVDALNAERKEKGMPMLTRPSRNTVHRKIRSSDLFHLFAGREGADYARRKFSFVHGGVVATRPLERVEMDEWTATLQTIASKSPIWERLSEEEREKAKTRRCFITFAIDLATRCIVGLHVSLTAPSGSSSTACLRLVLNDKTPIARAAGAKSTWHMHGSLEQIPTDAGPSFVNPVYRAAAHGMFAEHIVGPVRTPMLRGTIERLFRTTDQSLMQHFSGRTFESVAAKRDYDSEKQASLTPEELTRVIVRWIVDIYHHTEHRMLNNETPYNAWERLQKLYGVPAPLSADIQRHIFGLTMYARIGNRGIRALGISYQHEALQEIRRLVGQKRVRLRFDPADVSTISVEGPGDIGWINVDYARDETGEFDDLKGISLAQWLDMARMLRRKHADEANLSWPIVREAIRDIRALGEDAIARAGLMSPFFSDAEIEKYQRDLFRNFRIRESRLIGESDQAGDIFDDVPATEDLESFADSVPTSLPNSERSDYDDEGDWLVE